MNVLRNDRMYYTPVFEDRDGNEVTFLYQDYLCPSKEAAENVAAANVVQIIMLGLMYKRILEIPTDARVPHVECIVEDKALNLRYKIAIISGPEFVKHYDVDKAEETDRVEDRALKAKEQAEQLDRQNYEAEVDIINSALRKPDGGLH